MSEHEWDCMNETDFDAMLQNSLPEPPPDDIVRDVTPWRKAMDYVLVGLSFNAITLNSMALDYILPAIGLILMLLGFRTLRRENGWFRACLVITAIRGAYLFPTLVLSATIFQSLAHSSPFFSAFTVFNLVLAVSQCVCLWKGFKSVKEEAGLPPQVGAAAALAVWYLVISLLAIWGTTGTVLGIGFLVSYIFIIRSLFKLSKELDEAGYAIQAAPVRVPDRTVVVIILAALAVGIACGYLFGGGYPMKWTAAEPAEQGQTAEIKAHLIRLGFPEEVLQDLTTQDLLDCEGALQVVAEVQDHAVNDGRIVTQQGGNMTHQYTVYDVKELRITGIAVELPGDRERWKIFHHFRWLVDPGFYGTECLQLWTAYRSLDGWGGSGSLTGQVLYTLDGRRYTAPYYSLSDETYTSQSIFGGEQTSTDVFATFSMPREGENHRGYVSYTIAELQDGGIVDSWINYTHQQSWLQYPALTAMEQRIADSWNEAGAFLTVQDALQFYPTEGGAEKLS